MKVLFIGGTGIISSACSELAVKKSIDLYHLNRGVSINKRPIEGVKHIFGDIRKPETVKEAIKDHDFDCVIDWIAFTPDHIQTDIELFTGKTSQFVFISSASAYQTPAEKLPITEKTPLENPFWEYSRDKIACENLLKEAYASTGFPYTIVRPSHTYDKTLLPFEGGFTVFKRILDEKPVVLFGDGASIWTFTHNTDFAKGLVGLIGNKKAIAEDFQITNNELLSWNMIYETIASLLNKKLKKVSVPSELFARYHKEMGDSVLGDKMHSSIFDNSKIKSVVPDFECTTPFSKGAKELVDWHLNNMEKLEIDPEIDSAFDKMIAAISKAQ
jgi:nucleoside-diphosphate-sugar epimerase